MDAADNTPLIGTHIFLRTTTETQTTISDATGAFRFDEVANGAYDLKVSYIGYQSFSKQV